MAMTPRMWRRRIGTISMSGDPRSSSPVDLRIRLPHVEGYHVLRLGRLLPLEPRHGELEERDRGGEGVAAGGELDGRTGLVQRPAVQQGPVADEGRLLAGRGQLGGQAFRRAHGEGRLPSHPAGDGAVERVEDLAALPIDDRTDAPPGVTGPELPHLQRAEAHPRA